MTPLTIENMIAVHAESLGPDHVQNIFGAYNPHPYLLLYFSLGINTVEQLQAVMTNEDAMTKLRGIYGQHLGREPDGLAICANIPMLANEDANKEYSVVAGVMDSAECKDKMTSLRREAMHKRVETELKAEVVDEPKEPVEEPGDGIIKPADPIVVGK